MLCCTDEAHWSRCMVCEWMSGWVGGWVGGSESDSDSGSDGEIGGARDCGRYLVDKRGVVRELLLQLRDGVILTDYRRSQFIRESVQLIDF